MSPEEFHILVVADNPALRQVLRQSLTSTGFAFDESASGDETVKTVAQGAYDLVLLDLGISGPGAIATCRNLREVFPRLGIVVIRDGGTPEDEIEALEAGADDCVSSPFRFREIVARLGAVLRRSRVENSTKKTTLRAGDLEVDVHRRLCRRGAKQIHLSPKEFDLLVYFMKSPGIVLPHLKLLGAVWGTDAHRNAVYLRSYIKTLRKKIETEPGKPQYILTEPWVGYSFHNPERAGAEPGTKR